MTVTRESQEIAKSSNRQIVKWFVRWPLFAAFVLVGPQSSAQPPDATPAEARVEVVWAAGSPVALTSPRLGTEDGLPFVECLFVNESDAAAWQVDLLFLVYDAIGKRKAAHALTVAPSDLPIEAHGKRSAKIQLPYVDIGPDDTVRVGLTKVGTEAAAAAWANEKLGEESDAQMDALFAPPPLVVSSSEGAPVTISDVAVQADTGGHVISVSLTVTNPGDRPVLGLTVVAHVFDAAGRIRLSDSETTGPARALLPRMSYPMRLAINATDLPHATVWVAVESTTTPAWKNPDTLEQAKAAVQRRRR
jgi:hypothetical protein